MPEHNVLTDPDLHEPKGASTATLNQSIYSSGNGSTFWSRPQGIGVYEDSRNTALTPTQSLNPSVSQNFVCNGLNLSQEYLPSDATESMWNVSTNKHIPIRVNDSYLIQVSFTARGYHSNSFLEIGLNVNGVSIYGDTLSLLGAGMKVIRSFEVFVDSTYMTNGATISLIYGGSGTCDLDSNKLLIRRTGRNG